MPQKRLYPPPYQIAELLYFSIGQDPNVRISQPKYTEEHCFEICVHVALKGQAEALRVIVPQCYTYGNQRIETKVYSCDEEIEYPCLGSKNQAQVARVFCTALHTNYLFKGVILEEQCLVPIKSEIDVCIVKQKMPNGEWASENFAQVLKQHFGLLLCTHVKYTSHCQNGLGCHTFYCKGIY